MFQKFGSNLPQSLIDAATSISEAKVEPAKPDADAIARRKRLQALKDKQEDDAAEKSYKSDTGVRKVAGSSYGGAKQKDDDVNEEMDIVEFVESINEMDESELDEMINEVLGKSAKAGDWIHDFVHSDNPKFAGKSKAQRKKMALAAYYGKQRNEELKGNQHKIDANKNGKVDAHDFKLLRAKKKVNEESDDEHFEKQSKKMQDAINLHLRKGKSYKDAVESSKKHVKEDVELELILDLTEGKDEDDVPFDADKNPKKSAVAGKQGYGPSVAKHLARLGLKGAQKKKTNETLMGKAGATSEEVEIEESRGHKIIARKLADIDRRSSGVAPDYHDNAQSISDKLKDQPNTDKVEIVTQKDTSASSQKPDMSHMDDKQDLNKKSHGYGNVVHKEETEIDEATRIQDTQGGYNLKKGSKQSAADRKDAASVVKDFRARWRAKGRSTKRYDTNAQMDKETGFAATKEEVEQVDEVSDNFKKSLKQRVSSNKSDKYSQMSKTRENIGKGDSDIYKKMSDKQKSMSKEEVELDEVSAEMLGRYSDKANKEYNSPDGKKKEQRKKGLVTAYLKAKGRARVPATYKEETDLEESVFLVVHHGHDDPQYRMPKGKRVLNHSTKYQNSATKSAEHLKSKGFHDVQITKDGKPFTEEIELDETAALDQYIKSMGYDPEHTPKDKKVMFSKTNAFKTWATSRSRQESKSPGQEDDVHMSPGATARE